MSASPEAWIDFHWHPVQCRIPADWEQLTYSLDPTHGRFEFANREAVQAVLRRCPASRKEQKDPDIPCIGNERWFWEIPEGSNQSADELQQHLQSQKSSTWHRFDLHGIPARVPAGFHPVQAEVFPANVMLACEGSDGSRAVYRRWGLPDTVLAGKDEESFHRSLLQQLRFRVEERVEGGHHRFSCRGLLPVRRMLLQRAEGHAWIWREDEGYRLCTLEYLSHSRENRPSKKELWHAR